MTMPLDRYLDTVLHALDSMEGNDPDRQKEVAAIRKRVSNYRIGLQRVNTKEMVACITAGLEELAPQIEKLAHTATL